MKIYFVKAGDTLSAIAEKHGVTVQQLLEANPIIADPDDLKVAMKLIIPAKKGGHVPDSGWSTGQDMPAKAMGAKQTQATMDIPDKAKPAADLPVKELPGELPLKDMQHGASPVDNLPPKAPVSVPDLPKFPSFTGVLEPEPAVPAKKQDGACHACKAGGPAPMPKPLPYAMPQKQQMPLGTFGHPAGFMPPCPPIGGGHVAGPWQPGVTGGPTGVHMGVPFPQPAFPQGMPSGPWPGQAAVQHPFAAMPMPAHPVQAPQYPGLPNALGQGHSVSGGTWHGGQPASGTGFHSPYNTPFTVNPYLLPANQPASAGMGTPGRPPAPPSPGQSDQWEPYRLQTAAATAFISPHAAPPAGEMTGDMADEEETAPPRTGSVQSRKKTSGKKRKLSGDAQLRDKILRLQKNHRRH